MHSELICTQQHISQEQRNDRVDLISKATMEPIETRQKFKFEYLFGWEYDKFNLTDIYIYI